MYDCLFKDKYHCLIYGTSGYLWEPGLRSRCRYWTIGWTSEESGFNYRRVRGTSSKRSEQLCAPRYTVFSGCWNSFLGGKSAVA